MTKLKILLADDSPEFMDASTRFLAEQPWAEVIGRANCGTQSVRLAERLAPDLVLMDLVMPELNGLDATRRIKQLSAPPRIIILTLHDNAEYRLHAKEAGADGYVPKAQLQNELPDLVRELYGPKIKRRNGRKVNGNGHDLARRALADSEERLRLALSAGAMGIFDWNIATGVITWSEEHARLFGLRLEEFDGSYEAFARCVHPEDLPGVRAAAANARANRGTYEQVHRIIRPDGTVRWVSGRGRFHYDASGAAVRMVGVVSDITERKQADERLDYFAQHDALTGLPNRHLFLDRLNQAMIEARRHDRLVGVVLLDVDQFKKVNDTLGHEAGDALLKAIGERLRAILRAGDTVARLGGDEFSMVLADLANVDDTTLVLQKIMSVFENPFSFDERRLFMTASLGITIYPFDDTNSQDLLRNADIAMYRGKEQGRNSYQFYTAEMTVKATENMTLESALRGAIERGELHLCYQPQISVPTGAVVGVEALLRWNHPQLGVVPPGKFIPLAEETGLIVPIGQWVLRQACAQVQAWHAAGFSAVRLTVNLSSRQLQERDFPDTIRQILDETGFPAVSLDLELTESMLLRNVDETLGMLNRLNDMGIQFSVDDFGTGYSSLSYLKRLPIDVLKIDQSFVRDITTDIDDAAIVRAIITMAHSLGMHVVAEGVETREQLHFLLTNGCDTMQGYFFSKPQRPEIVMQMLIDRKALSPRRRHLNATGKRS